MIKTVIYPAITTQAVSYAADFLRQSRICIADAPGNDVTHYLFPIPTPSSISVPNGITVIGGNLPTSTGPHIDLLQDMNYLAENAAITAHCAITLAAQRLGVTFRNLPVLIIGWGRIGKCLAAQFKAVGAQVWIAARRESDRAMVHALGYYAIPIDEIPSTSKNVRVVFNTVPAPIPQPGDFCLKIDLASTDGLQGSDILHARGLPGKMAPESTGKLMAQTILRLLKGEERI